MIAKKIDQLKSMANEKKRNDSQVDDLKKKLSSLEKLYVVQKIPKDKRH